MDLVIFGLGCDRERAGYVWIGGTAGLLCGTSEFGSEYGFVGYSDLDSGLLDFGLL